MEKINKRAVIYILSIILAILSFAYYYYKVNDMPDGVESFRHIEDNMVIKMNEKVILEYEIEDKCALKDFFALAGCPIGWSVKEFYGIENYTRNLFLCRKEHYKLLEPKKVGKTVISYGGPCEDEPIEEYSIEIVE